MDEKANALLGEENVKNLANSNWKERLGAMESIEQVCLTPSAIHSPAFGVAPAVEGSKP